MDIEREFEDEFNALLNGRVEIDSFMKTLNLFNTNDIKIEVTKFIGYEDYNDEDYEVSEDDAYPGYHISINPNSANYKYLLFKVELPTKTEYPVKVEFRTLSSEKNFLFTNLNSLEDFMGQLLKVTDTFKNSNDYSDIVKRIYEVSNNI
jgi:hypothetical protein